MRYYLVLLLTLSMPLWGQHLPLKSDTPPSNIVEDSYEPYHYYSLDQMREVLNLSYSHTITKASLQKWDTLVVQYLAKHPPSLGENFRIFTYLYVAQAGFAFTSQEIHGSPVGSLDPISLGILRLFYPDFPVPKEMQTDPFSLALTDIILQKFRKRFHKESAAIDASLSYISKYEWSLSQESSGEKILGWISWILPNFATKFMPAPPKLSNKKLWQDQLDATIQANQNVTEEQKEFIDTWKDDWLTIANKYLFASESVDLDKLLYVRYFLSMSLYDAIVIAFEAKYNFLIVPPYIRSKEITPLVEVYNYPSYPSVETVMAVVAAKVLGSFFPQHLKEWEAIAQKVGESRIWAGVNYPIDVRVSESSGNELYRRLLLAWQ